MARTKTDFNTVANNKIRAFIEKWKINRALLAAAMPMPKGTFNNKLSENHESLFTDPELDRLRIIIGELKKGATEAIKK